jgi:hypothetical protein
MQMVWQHNHCVDRERVTLASFANGIAQCIHMVGQQSQPAIGEIYRKEETTARNEISTVRRHGLPYMTN